MDDEAKFQKYIPKITEVTTTEMAKTWGIGGEIISLNGKHTALDAFILVLADDEKQFPFLLTGVCARALSRFLRDGGFDPST